MNLNTCNDLTVDSAYVITIKGNETSEKLSRRCFDSCVNVGQPVMTWEAFDGTVEGDIKVPEHLKGASWLNWVKLMDTQLSKSEVACFMSHFSLWCHCLEINKPIVILEHDAVMVQPYKGHLALNQIVYLGCYEQQFGGFKVTPSPPYGSLPHNNFNYKYILRTHAYAIDPFSAKKLVSHFIEFGIWEELSVAIRADIFNIIQCGIFAYDAVDFYPNSTEKVTTIQDTKEKRYGE